MAAKIAAPFSIFGPSFYVSSSPRTATEIRFSRWNNANAEPFLRRQRDQKQLEDEIRRRRRYESASRMVEDSEDSDSSPSISPPEFRSQGTPSSPSKSSIPGKKSKYSKPEGANTRNSRTSKNSHPAFRRASSSSNGVARLPLDAAEGRPEIAIGENGVAYRIGDAPFEFQYSYTETPKVKPLALREPPYLPFGPATMPRPWTGRAPLAPSKKKLPEFDSFRPPPPGKKGVKPVQSPGPFLAGAGPKYEAASREDIHGEPLSREEVRDLIKGCIKTKRQLNIGRDGLTHNMLDNIHAHWKRRRVCKIKCKGVCTVDMNNVREQLEEKTGGKVIFSRGGVIFLFRGRNYNYRTRPKFPLMLWKPIPPVYPRLVQHVPEDLTLEEATAMRKIGRQLTPIYKLGKNGVYCNLVRDVREAFEECELVRINCQGLNKSDTRKIGAKLKDLVPCTLLSFEFEHILIWRGRNWKSSLPLISEELSTESTDDEALSDLVGEEEDNEDEEEEDRDRENSISLSTSACLEEVMILLNRAIEGGSAVILQDESLDADLVKERAAQLARTAPPSPNFTPQPNKPSSGKIKKVKYQSKEEKADKEEDHDHDLHLGLDLDDDVEEMPFVEIERSLREKKGKSGRRTEQKRDALVDMTPHGSLGVDELAKLLS